MMFLSDTESDWRAGALCRRHPNPDYWFPERDLSYKVRRMRTREAKIICNLCPVFYACREQAVRAGEDRGIWAGQDLGTAGGREAVVDAHPVPPSGEIARLYVGMLPEEKPQRENGPLTA